MYDFYHEKLPPSVQNLFEKNQIYHSHLTRQAKDPHIVPYHYQIVKNSFLGKAPELWSKVPFDITCCKQKKRFSKKIKKDILNSY